MCVRAAAAAATPPAHPRGASSPRTRAVAGVGPRLSAESSQAALRVTFFRIGGNLFAVSDYTHMMWL